MPEIKHAVKSYEVNYRCDQDLCEGEMIATGHENDGSGTLPKYQHKCNYCQALKWFDIKYPTVRHEPFGSEIK